jgi:hypothetical protein
MLKSMVDIIAILYSYDTPPRPSGQTGRRSSEHNDQFYEASHQSCEASHQSCEANYQSHDATHQSHDALGNGVAKLSAAAASSKTEEASMREASRIRAMGRKRLRALISRASLVARALHSEIVRPPVKDTEHELISIGRGFIDSVEPLKQDFVRHALSPDEVLEAVEVLEGAILSFTAAKTARSAALIQWNAAMAESLDALLGLDALVANVLIDNPVARASYDAVRSIPRSRGRAMTVAPEPPPVVPAVNAASAA